MNKKSLFKNALVVLGILGVIGGIGVTDTILSSLLWMFAILVALVLHMLSPTLVVQPNINHAPIPIQPQPVNADSVKQPMITITPQQMPIQQQPQPIPAMSPEEEKIGDEMIKNVQEQELLERKQRLDEQIAELKAKKEKKVQAKPKSQPMKCPYCEKVCRNETDYKRHLAFKHLDKITLQ